LRLESTHHACAGPIMAFGAKTIAVLVKEVTDNASMTELSCAGNSSIKMKAKEALEKIGEPLKKHKNIKRVILSDCEITDTVCPVLADILKENHVIEELILEKNKISSEGASIIADALRFNKGVRTLNLMQQAVKNFGEDTLDHFVTMFGDNITLVKIQWRLESRKSFMLNKLVTRNVEIRKRQDKGQDFNAFLPDHMKAGAPPVEAEAAAPASPEPAAPEATPAAPEPEETIRKRTSMADMETHLAAVEAATGELAEPVNSDPEEEKPPEAAGDEPAEKGEGYTEEEPAKAPEEDKPKEPEDA